MEISTVNQIIAACSGLGGALIGAGFTGWINRSISKTNHENEVRSFKAGFVAEVEAIQSVIKERGYLHQFEELAANPVIIDGGIGTYIVRIPEDYARFYNANLNKVGLVGPNLAKRLIKYHQLLQALAQDFHPESYFSQYGYDKDGINESIRIMKLALSTGDEITAISV